MLFVTTPGLNAVHCISVAMSYGFRRALICVAGILTQATFFLSLTTFGITALIAASPMGFFGVKMDRCGIFDLSRNPCLAQSRPATGILRARGSKALSAGLYDRRNQPKISRWISSRLYPVCPTRHTRVHANLGDYANIAWSYKPKLYPVFRAGHQSGTLSPKRNVQYLFKAYFSSIFVGLRTFIRLISFFKRNIGYDDFRVL